MDKDNKLAGHRSGNKINVGVFVCVRPLEGDGGGGKRPRGAQFPLITDSHNRDEDMAAFKSPKTGDTGPQQLEGWPQVSQKDSLADGVSWRAQLCKY